MSWIQTGVIVFSMIMGWGQGPERNAEAQREHHVPQLAITLQVQDRGDTTHWTGSVALQDTVEIETSPPDSGGSSESRATVLRTGSPDSSGVKDTLRTARRVVVRVAVGLLVDLIKDLAGSDPEGD